MHCDQMDAHSLTAHHIARALEHAYDALLDQGEDERENERKREAVASIMGLAIAQADALSLALDLPGNKANGPNITRLAPQ